MYKRQPYELVKELELHYQNVLFIVFKLVGFYVKAEYHTSQGRIDPVSYTHLDVYKRQAKIMELFKQKPVRLPAWDPMFAND